MSAYSKVSAYSRVGAYSRGALNQSIMVCILRLAKGKILLPFDKEIYLAQ